MFKSPLIRFLAIVLVAFLAPALGSALVKGNPGPILLAIAILLLFFVGPAAAAKLLDTLLGKVVGVAVLVAIVFFFANNQGACNRSLPVGDAGGLLDASRAQYQAESDYDQCLAGYLDMESKQNAPLDAARQQCAADAAAYVNGCLPQVQDRWWILDKGLYCRDQASVNVWRNCATMALQGRSADSGNVAFTACQSKSRSTGLMRSIAGIVSGMSSGPNSTNPAQTIAPVSYDTGCLVKLHNDNLGYMRPDFHCEQFLSKVYDAQGEHTVANDLPRYQDCLARTIVQGLGDAGTRLLRACQVPAR